MCIADSNSVVEQIEVHKGICRRRAMHIQVGLLPKNHSERFLYLKMHFKEAYELVSPLFKEYTDSYNKRVSRENAFKLRENVEEIKRIFKSEEESK